jgi:hypothetical protein
MTLLSRKFIVLKKWELLITISKTYNFYIEKKTVTSKYLQSVSLHVAVASPAIILDYFGVTEA